MLTTSPGKNNAHNKEAEIPDNVWVRLRMMVNHSGESALTIKADEMLADTTHRIKKIIEQIRLGLKR